MDVGDEAVVDGQQDEGKHLVVAQSDNADLVTDGQMQQRGRGWRPEVAQDSRGDLGCPGNHTGNDVGNALDGWVEEGHQSFEVASRGGLDESFADLLVEGWLIVELKTAKALADEHSAQVLGYLKSARLEHGLLINFGSYKFEMRKFAWSQDAARRKSKSTFLLSAVSAFFAFFAV